MARSGHCLEYLSAFVPFLRWIPSVGRRLSARRNRQRPDPPEHRPEQPSS